MGLGSGIRDPRSGIRKKPIPDSGSRGQKGTGSRIRIRNTAFFGIKICKFLYYFTLYDGQVRHWTLQYSDCHVFLRKCMGFTGI
jgi:hypothetical protein